MKTITQFAFGLMLFAGLTHCNTSDKQSSDEIQLPAEQVLFTVENKQDVNCYRIPALVTAPNGDLIVAIDERVPSCGDLKWSRDINIVVRRSSDNGQTWSDIEKVAKTRAYISVFKDRRPDLYSSPAI